jgi:Ser/Thr protein kinase RdoA (MazF antagonist)
VKKNFSEASHRAQIVRLRKLALQSVALYPIRVHALHFIHHGENTTFRVEAHNGRKYLLRIHRDNYHDKNALLEEMSWLLQLSKSGLSVPEPIRSKDGHFIETVRHPDITRNISILNWIDGRFVDKSLKPLHLFMAGELLAEIQNKTKQVTRLRRYWTAEGLVGVNAKFGAIDRLPAANRAQQKVITRTRETVLAKLRNFERKFPERQGLIHADLHFSNMLLVGGRFGAIDFDDCGLGFHAYDLVVPYISAEGRLGPKNRIRLPEFRDALIEGYKTGRNWDSHDDEIFDYLVAARKLLMLGWRNARLDHPRIRKSMKTAIANTVDDIKRENFF